MSRKVLIGLGWVLAASGVVWPMGARPNGDEPARPTVGRGQLHIDRSHPFYLWWGNHYLLLLGASERQVLTIWRSDKGFDWRR